MHITIREVARISPNGNEYVQVLWWRVFKHEDCKRKTMRMEPDGRVVRHK